MIASNSYVGQTKKLSLPQTRLVGTVILTVLWVLLSLFAFPCTMAEGAVPSREEIPGTYNAGTAAPNGVAVWFKGDTLIFGGVSAGTYDPATGTAFRSDKSGHVRVQFTKDAKGKVSMRAEQFFRGNPKSKIPNETVTYAGSKQGQEREGGFHSG